MSNSSSPTSSLLQMNRPVTLTPQLPTQSSAHSEQSEDQVQRTSSQRPKKRRGSHATSHISCTTSNAIASCSQGPAYLNVPATTSSSTDIAAADISPITSPTRQVTETCSQFLHSTVEVSGQAISRRHWQPDSSSALCSFALCTTNFGPAGNYSYFTLGPRRHHCRKCGHLYCGQHSTQRVPLVSTVGGKRSIAKERVCDDCFPRAEETPVASRSRRSSAWSENSQSTAPSDHLATPDETDGSAFAVSSIVLSQTTSLSRTSTRGHLEATIEDVEDLAPVEPWMGDGGVLSLYPLAVNASHAAKDQRTALHVAAGPLFGPSIAAKRNYKEKELERLSLRQRRLGSDNVDWVHGAWGYKREDFDPSYHHDDDEGEVEVAGGLVVDGPIVFRSRRIQSPARTPSEERAQTTF